MTDVTSFRDYYDSGLGLYSFKLNAKPHRTVICGEALKLPGIIEKLRAGLVKLGVYDSEYKPKHNNPQVNVPCIVVPGKTMEKHIRDMLSTGAGLGGIDAFKNEIEMAKKSLLNSTVTVEDGQLSENEQSNKDIDSKVEQPEQPPEQPVESKSKYIEESDPEPVKQPVKTKSKYIEAPESESELEDVPIKQTFKSKSKYIEESEPEPEELPVKEPTKSKSKYREYREDQVKHHSKPTSIYKSKHSNHQPFEDDPYLTERRRISSSRRSESELLDEETESDVSDSDGSDSQHEAQLEMMAEAMKRRKKQRAERRRTSEPIELDGEIMSDQEDIESLSRRLRYQRGLLKEMVTVINSLNENIELLLQSKAEDNAQIRELEKRLNRMENRRR